MRLKRTVLYILIDSGGSSKQTQRKRNGEVDDTGVAYIFVDEYGNWYVKAYGKKMDSMEIMELIFSNHVAYKVLETQAIEQTMFVEAIRPFYDQARKDRGQYPKLKLLKSGGRNKENRIRGLIPRYEARTIYHIAGECDQYEEQLLRFPRSKNDDVMDAVAYGNDIIKTPVFEETRQALDDYDDTEEFSPFAEIGG